MHNTLSIRVVSAGALGEGDLKRWAAIQESEPLLESPFFRPEYFLTIAHAKENARVAIMEREGTPIGYFPFDLHPGREARPIGDPLCDYQGIVINRDASWDPRQLIAGCDLRRWTFDHLIAGQTPFRPYHRIQTESPVIDLAEGYEAYAQERRKAGSQEIKKTAVKRRKLESRVGPLRLEIASQDPEALRMLRLWKSQQYLESGKADLFAHSWVVSVLEEAFRRRETGFSGMLSALYAADRLIAVHFGLRSHGILHSWFPAYDREFYSYSPGLILLLEVARNAADAGIQKIDLGKGKSLYKQCLMNRAAPLAEGELHAGPLRAALERGRNCAKAWLKETALGRWVRQRRNRPANSALDH